MSFSYSETRRSFAILVVGFTGLAFALSSCGRQKSEKAVEANLVVALENKIVTLDPMRATEVFSGRVVTQIYEGLVGLDGHNQIVPLIAERWDHDKEAKTWTFHIRPGVHFHPSPELANGSSRDVTAADAAFCLTRLVSPESPFAFALLDVIDGAMAYNGKKADSVTGIEVVDTNTLRVHLTFSDPFFINRMTSQVFGIYPPEAAKLGPDVFGTRIAVGTGPFMLQGQRGDEKVTLKRNPNYWRPVGGNAATIEFRAVQNDSFRLSDLRNGHINLAPLPAAQMREVYSPDSLRDNRPAFAPAWSKGFTADSFPTFNSHFLALNDKVLDAALRRAISLAINRRQIVDAVTYGSATVAPGPLPIAMEGYKPAYANDIFDLAAAKAALSQSSHKAGDTLEILVHGQEGARAIGELIQSQLQPLGINVKLVELDFNEVFSRVIQGNYQAAVFFFEYVFSTPGPILENFFTPGRIPNIWRFENQEFTNQFQATRSIQDRAVMNQRAAELEKIIVDSGASAFLFQKRSVIIHSDQFTNIQVNGHSMPLLWEVRMTP